MSNGEEPGFFGRLWNAVKKIVCTLICAWFEILVAVVVFIFAAVAVVVGFFAFFIGVAGDSFLVALSGGTGAPIGIGVLIVLIVIYIIILVLSVIVVAVTMEWMMKKVRRCWNSC